MPHIFSGTLFVKLDVLSGFSIRYAESSLRNIWIGSDQCWNDRLHEEGRDYFYLDFVSDDRKKVSYAASFGRPEGAVPKKRGQKLFGRFQAVSVREEFDVELFEKSYGIAAYILNPTEEKRKFCLSLQKSLGNMKLINIIDAY